MRNKDYYFYLMRKIGHIAVIGSGNAGTYFLHSLQSRGLSVAGYSRNSSKGFRALSSFEKDCGDFDLTLLCVPDKVVGPMSSQLPPVPGIIAHVSGVTDLSVIDNKHKLPAVFYPLMSLTPDAPPEMENIPFCIEANDPDLEATLAGFAQSLGASAHFMPSAKRAYLHLGAVISQNFSNYLHGKAHDVLEAQGIDFRLLIPLLEQSLKRLQFSNPASVQTGPAVRNDQETIARHLAMIEDKDLQEIYRLLSKNIKKTHDEKL